MAGASWIELTSSRNKFPRTISFIVCLQIYNVSRGLVVKRLNAITFTRHAREKPVASNITVSLQTLEETKTLDN